MGKDLTSSRALKSYAIAGASAGLMNKLSSTLNLPSQPKGWEQHVQGSAVRAAVSTPLNIFIGDCKPEEAAFNGLKCFVANSTGDFISENIGDVFDAKKINEITRYLAHGGGGAVTGAILSIGEGDILRRMSSAAVSAMTAEVASDLFSQGLKDQEQSLIKKAHQEGRSLTRREIKDFGQVVQVKADIAKIVGTACSLLVGRDVGTAFMAANNAVEYNYAQHVLLTLAAADVMLELYTLTHPEEAEALKQRAIQAVAEKTGFTPEAIEQSFHGMMMAGSLAGGGKNLLKGLGTSLLKSEVGKRVQKIFKEYSLRKGEAPYHSKYWNKTQSYTFNGQTNKVYKRDDLIDPNKIDFDGRTNLQRMQEGFAPLGPDNKSLELHHTIQTKDSNLTEVTRTFHKKNTKIIHINPSTTPSGISRNEFGKWRESYWQERAKDFLKKGDLK